MSCCEPILSATGVWRTLLGGVQGSLEFAGVAVDGVQRAQQVRAGGGRSLSQSGGRGTTLNQVRKKPTITDCVPSNLSHDCLFILWHACSLHHTLHMYWG